LKEKGKEVKRFYGDKAYDTNEIYNLGVDVVVPPRKDASTRRGHPARRKAVREFKKLGYERWRDEKGYGNRWLVESLFSAVKHLVSLLGLRVLLVKLLRLSSSFGLMLG